MRILHSGSLNVLAGGPALSMMLTIKGLLKQGIEVVSLTEPINKKGKLISSDLDVIYTRPSKFGTLAYVPRIMDNLISIGHVDLFHIQGIWMLHGTQIATYARKHNIPYIVTLRGMLYPEAISHNSFIKKLSLRTYQGCTLKNAAAIQATCVDEMKYYRDLGFTNPVAVIPNPIDVEHYIDTPISIKEKFRIGYLGRIHPRKRIERLIYAMANLRDKLPKDTELLIIGGGDENYEDFLHKEVSRLNLTDQVRFTGFISGKEKEEAIDSLSILAVPSDFENFGNIVTEALVHGVPVIASKGMPWKELQENECGWWIDNDQDSINQTILKAFQIGAENLREMGLRGRELMVRYYSVEALGKKMSELYNWIINGGIKPKFVYTINEK